MKLTKELLLRIISEEKQKISKERLRKKEKGTLNEATMVSLQPIQRMKRKDESLESKWMRIAGIDTNPVNEGEVIDFPGGSSEPELPWVFGPEGYIKRSELSQQYEKKEDVGADSPPEVMIARAMAYRASELTNYQQEFDDEIFSDYAMRIYQDYIVGKSGDKFQALDSMLNRIDDGGWDDEEIMEIASTAEMSQTKEMAARQDPAEVAQDDIDFSAFLDNLGQNVIEFPEED
tara:strand:+ start:543 stop:1241 length:699 start_codon:yes stop_codon:yes gene_type:complete